MMSSCMAVAGWVRLIDDFGHVHCGFLGEWGYGRKEGRKGGFLSCTPLRRRAGTQLTSCTRVHGMRWDVGHTLVCSARATLGELSVAVV
jgi:hypothetical protein